MAHERSPVNIKVPSTFLLAERSGAAVNLR
jgi:hypothetical protein